MADVILVDTTLRDGEQAPGFAFSRCLKVRLAALLDAAGVGQIEAGIPAMGPGERKTLCKIMDVCFQARVSTWNRLCEADIKNSLACAPHVIHICCPLSDRQIFCKLRSDRDKVMAALQRCIELAASGGAEVSVGFEDVSYVTGQQLTQATTAAAQAGARRVRLSDTVGRYTPDAVAKAVRLVLRQGLEAEIHAHNDFGMAVPNSLMAAFAGARYVDTTLWGIGERAGNCGMGAFTAALDRLEHHNCAVSGQGAARLEKKAAPFIPRALLEAWNVPAARTARCSFPAS